MAYEIYPHDVPIESPGDQCKNFHYRQAYISGFKKAMELYRTQPEEREERVRIAEQAVLFAEFIREDPNVLLHYGKKNISFKFKS